MRSLRLQQIPDLERFLEPVDPGFRIVELPAIGLVLAPGPARADSEGHPPAGDFVDGHRLLEQEDRIAIGVARHHDAQPHAAGERRQRGQHGVGLVGRLHDIEEPIEVIDHIEAVPPGLLGGDDTLGELGEARPLPADDSKPDRVCHSAISIASTGVMVRQNIAPRSRCCLSQLTSGRSSAAASARKTASEPRILACRAMSAAIIPRAIEIE